MAEATQLEQAFLNLILNAAEAMAGGGTLTITSRPVRLPRNSQNPTHVAVEFTDTGQGMTEQVRRRAFTSMLTTTKRKGTGLGLAIVRRVLETHRGKLKIKSLAGRGTTVTVILPV
jgi:signal transduction histidine kinase